MYPAQTSLIPVHIALARFLEQSGLSALVSDYPYWYLGTTPFRYLTGPILPSFLVGLHRLLPSLTLFDIFFGVVGVVWVVGGVGVYWLVKALAGSSTSEESSRATIRGVLAAGFYLFGSIVPFLFRFSDGLHLIAFSFLPLVLLLYLKSLKTWSRRLTIFTVLMISFVILLDSLIIPTLVLGMGAIFLAQVGWKKMEEKLKQTFLIFAFSFLIATIWYTPGYWLTLLGAPSFGGKGLASVIIWLGKLLPTALAFTLAIVSAKFFKKRNLLRDFCFYWLFIFGFLTLIRFLSDPDFWLDWSAYGLEIQLGLAIALGIIASKIYNLKSKILLFTFYFLLFTFVLNKYFLSTLQQDITQTVEYRIGKWLDERAREQEGEKAERVFLSGTTAFWLNAFFDIPQVRGGVDRASVDPNWRATVWEIREGDDIDKSLKWLKELEVNYLVVHTEKSEEFYHDFAYPEKFTLTDSLTVVYSKNGDIIYQID